MIHQLDNEQKEQEYLKSYDESLKLWPVKYTDYFITTSFGKTYVIESGQSTSPPLLLLHGGSMSSTMWYPNMMKFTEKYRVIAIDILGDKNKSVPTKEFTDRASHAKWLEEVMDGLEIPKADFVALSYGALNVVNFLLYAPHRANRVIVMSPAETFVSFSPEFYAYAFGMVQNRQGVENFLKWVFGDRYSIEKQIAEQLTAGMMWIDPDRGGKPKKSGFPYIFTDKELCSIQTPLLLLLGEHEVMYDHKQALERAKSLMPNTIAEIVSGVGHLMSMEDPDYTAARALSFLETGK